MNNVQWLPTAVEEPPKPTWKYNGMCLDCESFAASLNDTVNASLMPINRWKIEPLCSNCDQDKQVMLPFVRVRV